MANTGVSHSEVKSICNELEVSPSKTQPTSALYNGGGTEPEAKSHSAKHKSGAGGHLTNSESGFGKKGTSMPRNIAAGKRADSNKKV
jgi:hypothetical protein